jgi:hypothetical protein
MCAGAVLTVAVLVTVLVTLSSVRSAAVHDVDFTGAQWHTALLTQIVPVVAGAPIVAGLWLWLAWANGRGHVWARPAFTALVGLLAIGLLFGLAEGGVGRAALVLMPDVIATTVLLLVGLAAMLLIFSETASPFYQRRPATRAATPASGTGP